MSFWTIFYPFSPSTTWKSNILTLKKAPEDIAISHICTINDNHMMYGSWDMEHNRHNFLSFCLFFALLPLPPPMDQENQNFEKMKKNSWRYYHFTKAYHKWQSYAVRFLRYGVQQTEFFVILGHFLPFYPPKNPKNQNFEKMKKPPRDIIILHRCKITGNHMMYGSLDNKHNRQTFLSFWTIFCLFTILTAWKIKILKKWKNHLNILSLYTCLP